MLATAFTAFAICMLVGLVVVLVGGDWLRETRAGLARHVNDVLDEDDMSQW